VIAVGQRAGRMEGTPDVVTRGVVLDDRTSGSPPEWQGARTISGTAW